MLLYHLTCLGNNFYGLSTLVSCWSLVLLGGLFTNFKMCVFLITQLTHRFNDTSWEAVVTPTDRPKSVRNRCVIEVFVGVFVFSRCVLDFSVSVGVFVVGLSQISSFFS